MKKLLILVMAILLIAAGCGTANSSEKDDGTDPANGSDQAGEQNDDQVNLEQILQQLEMTADINPSADKVTFDFHLKNTGEKAVELGFSSGQQYEIIVENDQKEEVYRYSEGKMFTEAFVYKEVKPDKSLSWTEDWNYKHEAQRVESGTYSVEITLLPAQLNKQPIEAKPFSITKTLTIPSASESTAFRNIEVKGEGGAYTVTGEARVFEGVFFYNVEDEHQMVVKEQKVMVDQGAPKWSSFELKIDIPESDLPINGTLTLIMYEKSAKDGKKTNQKYIPLDTIQQ